MADPLIHVQFRCRTGPDGRIDMHSCDVAGNGITHRIVPDTPADLTPLLAGVWSEGEIIRPDGSGRIRRFKARTAFGGQIVQRLTWINGVMPTLRFLTDIEGLSGILATHFDMLETPRTIAAHQALNAYETAVLPALNIAAAWSLMTSDRAACAMLFPMVQDLSRRVAAMKLVLDLAPERAGAQVTAGARVARTARAAPTSRHGTTMQIVRPCGEPDFVIQSLSMRRGASRHKLVFVRSCTLQEVLGDGLGDIIAEELSKAHGPVNVVAMPELEYWEPGFVASGAQFNTISSARGNIDLSASVMLRQTHGMPRALRRLAPWPENMSDTIAATAGSLRVHVALALEATSELLETLAGAARDPMRARFVSHQEEYLWLLANLIGRNLQMEPPRAAPPPDLPPPMIAKAG